jgi:hypothetical protein
MLIAMRHEKDWLMKSDHAFVFLACFTSAYCGFFLQIDKFRESESQVCKYNSMTPLNCHTSKVSHNDPQSFSIYIVYSSVLES